MNGQQANAVSFDDLEDSGEWTQQTTTRYRKFDAMAPAAEISLGAGRSVATAARFPCFKCRGSGRFITYTGRDLGACHRCKGTGKQKTDPDAARKAREAREQQAAARALTLAETFRLNNPEIASWLTDNAATFDFARSLQSSLNQWGSLTDGQIAAVQKCIDRQKQKDAERAARKPDADVAGTGFTRMLEAFASARASALKAPKLRIGEYAFTLASAASANAGCLYVKRGEVYVGKITAVGGFFASRDASDEDKIQVARIGADPLGTAVAHGKKTGYCACCNRLLENEESVRLGIGPICREKWGL